MTIQTTELYRSFHREILVQVIMGHFLVSSGIIDADIRVAHLSEVLTTLLSLIDSSSKYYFLYLRIYLCQIHINGLIVLTFWSIFCVQVIAHRLYRTVRRLLIVIEYKELVLGYFPITSQHECRSIQVEIIACTLVGVPSKSNTYQRQTLFHVYALTLYKINHIFILIYWFYVLYAKLSIASVSNIFVATLQSTVAMHLCQ